MAITRVFTDTNTLFPFYICDLLLHCAEEDLFRVLWSEDLLTELVEVVPRSGHKTKSRLTVQELLDRLSHPTGAPRFAARVRRRLK